MARLYLVRHGKAASGWGESYDPGLDDLGRVQAEATAQALAPLGPLTMISSPLVRAVETSVPLAETWCTTPRVEVRVGEIPSPTDDLLDRAQWLQDVMGDKWSNLDADLESWRRGVIDALRELDADTVVFTHFIAINAAVGVAIGDDSVTCFRPDNGSITIIDVKNDMLSLIRLGAVAATNKESDHTIL